MKTKETTKVVTHYIANDGKDFGEDRAACELYEFENPYMKDIEKIPKLENIMFFYNRIDAYWCESQEEIDLCCKYFQECKRKENLMTKKRNEDMDYLDALCVGRYLYPGYYFIIKLNSEFLDSYGMFSLSQLENFWTVFLAQIPISPEAKDRLERLHAEMNIDIQNKENVSSDNSMEDELPKSVKEIFENIEKESLVNNKKVVPKIYTSENLNEYKAKKENKENGDAKNE